MSKCWMIVTCILWPCEGHGSLSGKGHRLVRLRNSPWNFILCPLKNLNIFKTFKPWPRQVLACKTPFFRLSVAKCGSQHEEKGDYRFALKGSCNGQVGQDCSSTPFLCYPEEGFWWGTKHSIAFPVPIRTRSVLWLCLACHTVVLELREMFNPSMPWSLITGVAQHVYGSQRNSK